MSSRSKKSILNSITALSQVVINCFLGLIVIKLVLVHYGSDFNGLNATATQLVNILLLLEGGFTTASNVALFKPFNNNNYDSINSILTATKNRFHRVAVIFCIVGLFSTIVYSFIVNSSLPKGLIISLFLMALLPSAVNFAFTCQYRVVVQADQKEYVISFFTLVTTTAANLATIVAIILGCPSWMVRFITMVVALVNYVSLTIYVKRKYRFIAYNDTPDYEAISGSRDVFILKIAAALYSSAPLIVISTFSTQFASVYAVYNMIFSVIRNGLNVFSSAPRYSFGALIASNEDGSNNEKIYSLFLAYELVVFSFTIILLTPTMILIIPFIRLYTAGITDIGYVNFFIAYIFCAISLIENTHMPSGWIITMAGRFTLVRNIQLVVCVMLFLGLGVCVLLSNMYGLLLTLLIVAIVRAILELFFARKIFFKNRFCSLARTLLPNICLGLICAFIGMRFLPDIQSYGMFAIFGIILVLSISLLTFLLNIFVNREEMRYIIKTFLKPMIGRLKI